MSKAYLIYEKSQDFTVKGTYTNLLQICTSRSLTRAFVEAYVTNRIEDSIMIKEVEVVDG